MVDTVIRYNNRQEWYMCPSGQMKKARFVLIDWLIPRRCPSVIRSVDGLSYKESMVQLHKVERKTISCHEQLERACFRSCSLAQSAACTYPIGNVDVRSVIEQDFHQRHVAMVTGEQQWGKVGLSVYEGER